MQIGKKPAGKPEAKQTTAQPGKKSPISKKQIPTILGLLVLVVSLIAGLLLFSDGTGVFAPRATPETTPKNVKVTNLTDKSFTVSFYTDEATSGFVKFGIEDGSLKSQASDDRDQLSGTIGDYRLHHVTVRGLNPNTTYFYTLGTASVSRFDNNGAPFTVRTLPAPSGTPPVSKTIYGTVVNEAGSAAEGSIVYVLSEGVGEMSSLVKSSGSWAIALANARQSDGSGFANLNDDTELSVIVQGVEPTKSSIFSTTVADAQPVPELTLGQTPEARPVDQQNSASNQQIDLGDLDDIVDQAGGDVDDLVEEEVLDLSSLSPGEEPTVESPSPVIRGKAAPGVTVTIEVNSETQIVQTLVADENGDFELDLAAIGGQLEPGQHTVSYSYNDPDTGQEVTKTQTFTVAGSAGLLAQGNTGDDSFGSGNPVPLTPTPTPTPTASPTAEVTTKSAVVSTDSGTYQAGTVENTIALVIGGLFFMFAGAWSWWLAKEAKQV